DGNTKVQFDINTNKITDDSKKGVSKVGEIVEGLKKEASTKNEVTVPTSKDLAPSTNKSPLETGPGR
ncbi:MAG: hypothetical protein U0798_15555, partial [Gemmataceae bacterium]